MIMRKIHFVFHRLRVLDLILSYHFFFGKHPWSIFFLRSHPSHIYHFYTHRKLPSLKHRQASLHHQIPLFLHQSIQQPQQPSYFLSPNHFVISAEWWWSTELFSHPLFSKQRCLYVMARKPMFTFVCAFGTVHKRHKGGAVERMETFGGPRSSSFYMVSSFLCSHEYPHVWILRKHVSSFTWWWVMNVHVSRYE